MITRVSFVVARHLFILAACFAVSRTADATAIVYVKYAGGYIVAADSLVIAKDAHKKIVRRHYGCKLYVEDVTKTVFAVAGNLGQRGSQDVEELSKPIRQAPFPSADSADKALYDSLKQNQQFRAC